MPHNFVAVVLQKLYSDMQKFYFSKDVVGFAVSVTMGFATRDVILAIVHDVVVPVIKYIANLVKLNVLQLSIAHAIDSRGFLPVWKALCKVCHSIFLWLVLLLFSFLLLEYLVGQTILGFKSGAATDDGKEKEFVMAKVAAKVDPVIPLDQEDMQYVASTLENEDRMERHAMMQVHNNLQYQSMPGES
jgi:large-conductance mechanosensitive channel